MEQAFLERDRETERLGGWLDEIGRSGSGVLVMVAATGAPRPRAIYDRPRRGEGSLVV